jgi:hypothetical protein
LVVLTEIAEADETISCRVENHYEGFVREISRCVLFPFDTCEVAEHGCSPSKRIATEQVKTLIRTASIADKVGISSVSESYV